MEASKLQGADFQARYGDDAVYDDSSQCRATPESTRTMTDVRCNSRGIAACGRHGT